MKNKLSLTCLALALCLGSSAVFAQSEDWSDSPEAYFLTAKERTEWLTLRSQADRDAFKAKYWARRDPTPATAQNEFRDIVQQRIRFANERFKIGDSEGARSARGFAFIVFGAPSRTRETAGVRPGGDTISRGAAVPPRAQVTGGNDGLESTVVWRYERDKAAKILEALGRPSLDLTFYIEPERHRDRFEVEGLPRELAAIIAEKTILNPDAAAPASSAPSVAIRPLTSAALSSTALSAEAAAALAAENVESRVKFGYASLLDKRQIAAWFFVPASANVSSPKIVASLTGDDNAASSLTLDAVATNELLASEGGTTYGVRFPMPAPGAYSGTFALMDGGRFVANGRIAKLTVPPSSDFGISNVMTTGGVEAPTSNSATFNWGDVQILPRADNTFRINESVWYFVQVANPSDAAKLLVDVRLRGASPVPTPARGPAEAGKIGDNLYLIGRELPLMALKPGAYSLYVTVVDGANEKVSRSDFTVVGPN